MRFGSAFAWSKPGADTASFNNPNYAALLEKDCSILVPENELKWAVIRPSATTFDFSRADEMLAYAEAHDMAMRGHNLLWYDGRFDPAWLETYDFGADKKAGALALVRTHIQTVMRHYGTRISSWDVVNEAVEPSTGGLRSNRLQAAISNSIDDDYTLLDMAFRTAREEQPGAQLVYNDYMDWGNATHRGGVLQLLKGFKDRGVPVDALGIQSHLDFRSNASVASLLAKRQPELREFLDEVTALGYDLLITEMDVNNSDRKGTVEQRDADVAALAKGWLDVVMSYPQLRDVLVWGMVDKYSWLQPNRPDYDTPLRPNPYDSNFQPKPLRETFAAAFAATADRG